MKTIKGNLILKEDTTFNEDLKVEGNILGENNIRFNIDAKNIDAWNINAWNINAWNIDARNIDAENINAKNIDAKNIDAWNIDAENINAENIDAENINAENIDAWDIICEKRIKKTKHNKTICRILIQNKNNIEKGEKLTE